MPKTRPYSLDFTTAAEVWNQGSKALLLVSKNGSVRPTEELAFIYQMVLHSSLMWLDWHGRIVGGIRPKDPKSHHSFLHHLRARQPPPFTRSRNNGQPRLGK